VLIHQRPERRLEIQGIPGRILGFLAGCRVIVIHEYDEKSGYISYLQENRYVPLFASAHTRGCRENRGTKPIGVNMRGWKIELKKQIVQAAPENLVGLSS